VVLLSPRRSRRREGSLKVWPRRATPRGGARGAEEAAPPVKPAPPVSRVRRTDRFVGLTAS
jgi:hypothetical protein